MEAPLLNRGGPRGYNAIGGENLDAGQSRSVFVVCNPMLFLQLMAVHFVVVEGFRFSFLGKKQWQWVLMVMI